MKKRIVAFIVLGRLCLSAIPILMILNFVVFRNLKNIFLITMLIILLAIVGTILTLIGYIGPSVSNFFKSSSIRKTGILTFGRLISARQTGMMVNNQPQQALTIEIELPNGRRVVSEVLAIVPLNNLAYFQEGAVLPVRYDKEDPQKMALDMNQPQHVLQEAMNQEMIRKGIITEETIEIARRGQKGQAVILELNPTGKIVGNNPEISFRLKITKANGDQYETSQTKIVLSQTLDSLTVGSVVPVAYLPEDEEKVTFMTTTKFG